VDSVTVVRALCYDGNGVTMQHSPRSHQNDGDGPLPIHCNPTRWYGAGLDQSGRPRHESPWLQAAKRQRRNVCFER
jgi:hypothetical protein